MKAGRPKARVRFQAPQRERQPAAAGETDGQWTREVEVVGKGQRPVALPPIEGVPRPAPAVRSPEKAPLPRIPSSRVPAGEAPAGARGRAADDPDASAGPPAKVSEPRGEAAAPAGENIAVSSATRPGVRAQQRIGEREAEAVRRRLRPFESVDDEGGSSFLDGRGGRTFTVVGTAAYVMELPQGHAAVVAAQLAALGVSSVSLLQLRDMAGLAALLAALAACPSLQRLEIQQCAMRPADWRALVHALGRMRHLRELRATTAAASRPHRASVRVFEALAAAAAQHRGLWELDVDAWPEQMRHPPQAACLLGLDSIRHYFRATRRTALQRALCTRARHYSVARGAGQWDSVGVQAWLTARVAHMLEGAAGDAAPSPAADAAVGAEPAAVGDDDDVTAAFLEPDATYEGQSRVTCASAHPRSGLLAAARLNGHVDIFDTSSHRRLTGDKWQWSVDEGAMPASVRALRGAAVFSSAATAVEWAPIDDILAVASRSGEVRLFRFRRRSKGGRTVWECERCRSLPLAADLSESGALPAEDDSDAEFATPYLDAARGGGGGAGAARQRGSAQVALRLAEVHALAWQVKPPLLAVATESGTVLVYKGAAAALTGGGSAGGGAAEPRRASDAAGDGGAGPLQMARGASARALTRLSGGGGGVGGSARTLLSEVEGEDEDEDEGAARGAARPFALPHDNAATSLAWTRTFLAVGLYSGAVALHGISSLRNPRPAVIARAHSGPCHAVTWCTAAVVGAEEDEEGEGGDAGGGRAAVTYLASAGADGQLCVWDVFGRTLYTPRQANEGMGVAHGLVGAGLRQPLARGSQPAAAAGGGGAAAANEVRGVAFSAARRLAATVDRGGGLAVWALDRLFDRQVMLRQGNGGAAPAGGSYMHGLSPRPATALGRRALGAEGGAAETVVLRPSARARAHEGAVEWVRFLARPAAGGALQLLTCSRDRAVRRWRYQSEEARDSLFAGDADADRWAVIAASRCPRSNRLVAVLRAQLHRGGYRHVQLGVWDAGAHRLLCAFAGAELQAAVAGEDRGLRCLLDWSPDGAQLVVAAGPDLLHFALRVGRALPVPALPPLASNVAGEGVRVEASAEPSAATGVLQGAAQALGLGWGARSAAAPAEALFSEALRHPWRRDEILAAHALVAQRLDSRRGGGRGSGRGAGAGTRMGPGGDAEDAEDAEGAEDEDAEERREREHAFAELRLLRLVPSASSSRATSRGAAREGSAAKPRRRRRRGDAEGALTCVCWSPDGRYIAAGGADLRVSLYLNDFGDIRPVAREVDGDAALVEVSFSPDGRYLATRARNSPRLSLWQVAVGRRKEWLLAPGAVAGMAWHPSSRALAVGTVKGSVHAFRIDDAGSSAIDASVHVAETAVTDVEFAWTGSILLCAVASGAVHRVPCGLGEGGSVSFGTLSAAMQVQGTPQRLLPAPQGGTVSVVTAASADAGGDREGESKGGDGNSSGQHRSGSGGGAKGGRQHEAAAAAAVPEHTATRLLHHSDHVVSVSWQALDDGERLTSAGSDGLVVLWRGTEAEVLLDLGSRGVGAAAWSPDGAILAVGSVDGRVRFGVVPRRRGRRRPTVFRELGYARLDAISAPITAVAWASDSVHSVAVAAADGTVVLLELGLERGEAGVGGELDIVVYRGTAYHLETPPLSLAWTPGGEYVAVPLARSHSVALLRMGSGSHVADPITVAVPGEPTSVAFAPQPAALTCRTAHELAVDTTAVHDAEEKEEDAPNGPGIQAAASSPSAAAAEGPGRDAGAQSGFRPLQFLSRLTRTQSTARVAPGGQAPNPAALAVPQGGGKAGAEGDAAGAPGKGGGAAVAGRDAADNSVPVPGDETRGLGATAAERKPEEAGGDDASSRASSGVLRGLAGDDSGSEGALVRDEAGSREGEDGEDALSAGQGDSSSVLAVGTEGGEVHLLLVTLPPPHAAVGEEPVVEDLAGVEVPSGRGEGRVSRLAWTRTGNKFLGGKLGACTVLCVQRGWRSVSLLPLHWRKPWKGPRLVPVREFQGCHRRIGSLALSPSGELLATCGDERTVKVFLTGQTGTVVTLTVPELRETLSVLPTWRVVLTAKDDASCAAALRALSPAHLIGAEQQLGPFARTPAHFLASRGMSQSLEAYLGALGAAHPAALELALLQHDRVIGKDDGSRWAAAKAAAGAEAAAAAAAEDEEDAEFDVVSGSTLLDLALRNNDAASVRVILGAFSDASLGVRAVLNRRWGLILSRTPFALTAALMDRFVDPITLPADAPPEMRPPARARPSGEGMWTRGASTAHYVRAAKWEKGPRAAVPADARTDPNLVSVRPSVIGIPRLGGEASRIMDSFLHHLVASPNDDIYASKAVRALISQKWQAYAKPRFIRDGIVYAMYLVAFVYYSWATQDVIASLPQALSAASSPGGSDGLARYPAVSLVLSSLLLWALWLVHLYREGLQVALMGRRYLSAWNVLDVLTQLGVVLSLLLPYWPAAAEELFRPIVACTAVVVWTRSTYFLRAHSATSALVRLIQQSVIDMIPFASILTTFVLAFANAFFVLMASSGWPRVDEYMRVPQFATAPRSVVATYQMLMGDFDGELFDTAHYSVLAWALFVLFTVACVIVMLNQLIAILGATFDKVQARQHLAWQKERALIIVETEVLGQGWLHVPQAVAHTLQRVFFRRDIIRGLRASTPRFVHVLFTDSGESRAAGTAEA